MLHTLPASTSMRSSLSSRGSFAESSVFVPRPRSHIVSRNPLQVTARGKGGEEGGRVLDDSVFGKVAKSPNFTLLASAVSKAGLESVLLEKKNLTLFAPNDDAFTDFAKTQNVNKMELMSLPSLGDILKNHVVEGVVKAADLSDGQEVATLGSDKLKIGKSGASVKVNGASVKKADFAATNGVIHVIDKVLA